jgi:hypothetical protein
MKKISLLTKIVFHISNIGLIAIYLYPGSIMGWVIYKDIKKQPQFTSDISIFSSNHIYAFIILSLIGLISFNSDKLKNLFIYLFSISIFLELCHTLIPKRSFQYSDLLGNLLGVLIVFIVFNFYQYSKRR